VGEEILIIQMKNSDPATGYSEIVSSEDFSGGRQRVAVKDVQAEGKKIILESPLIRNFPANFTQVITIRNFKAVKIYNSSTLTAPAYNGSTGGVLALNVGGELFLDSNSLITMFAKGYPSARLSSNLNGPGGGIGGGYGGYGGDYTSTSGLVYGPPTNLFMGSGGGFGDSFLASGTHGYGGGLIMLSSDTMKIYGKIEADGNGAQGSGASGDSGRAGGGSGGGIEMISSSITFGGVVSAAGGSGSSYGEYPGYSDEGEYTYASWTSGQRGQNGKGGSLSGGGPGIGGNGGRGSSPSIISMAGFSAGAGGSSNKDGIIGGGGGAAGRIFIKTQSFNGATPNGYADAPGAPNKIGPYAYFMTF
jgi:hypothetical protein